MTELLKWAIAKLKISSDEQQDSPKGGEAIAALILEELESDMLRCLRTPLG